MKAFVVSDTHIHPFRDCSKNGGIDRMNDGLNVLNLSFKYAIKNKCDFWVLNGDVKLRKHDWPQQSLAGLLRLFEKYHQQITIVVLSGNGSHDGVGKDTTGKTGLVPFRPFARTFHTPTVCEIKGFPFAIWPWQPDKTKMAGFLDQAKAMNARTLLAHGFLSGSSIGPLGIKLNDAEFTLEEFGLLGKRKNRVFDLGLFGDIHKQQMLGDKKMLVAAQVWYSGDPYQQNRGERNDPPKGGLLVDLTSKEVKPVSFPSPRYIMFESCKELVDSDEVAGNFVTVVDDAAALRKLPKNYFDKYKTLARYFEVVTRRAEEKEKPDDFFIHSALEPEKLLKQYAKATEIPEGVSKQKLLQTGLQLLEETRK